MCKNPSPHPLDTYTKAGKENAQPESTKEQIRGGGVGWAGHGFAGSRWEEMSLGRTLR